MKFYTLDVFTNQIFSGNQLAVFPEVKDLSDEIMQKIAVEFNFSETVFVFDDEKADFRLRIFTPGGEIPFAGHPTIGTAFLLAKLGKIDVDGGQVIFREGVGDVPVTIFQDKQDNLWTELRAPSTLEFYKDCPSRDDLARVLSLGVDDLMVDNFVPMGASCGLPFLLVPLRDRGALSRAKVDLGLWEGVLKDFWAPHVYPFVQTGEDCFQVRMFAPGLNITEDPATGSAATAFAGYLATYKQGDGCWSWNIAQGLEMGRPSQIRAIALKTDNIIEEIRVGGESVIVTEGFLRC
ncbi:PhzF family phenazine biosynthesis protein [Cyanobacterium stanieri LEGE 03274]|uniref:PhzF family phenazine biosynthesis protein n=1 Tax=Cyanobacterium stanieri LEGE 03274 TaxID=1828756 RepID=A0ABR9V363_9CHRO|nr:PhzF family phenazine biosynthesis protein [Cyanobacterium stanieri]MBE9222329.1 PhzF family phenazine biosynthesis protein [Cyanobacterium stanieri LEGE 03274]